MERNADSLSRTALSAPRYRLKRLNWVAGLGKEAIDKYVQAVRYIGFLGEVSVAIGAVIKKPSKLKKNSLAHSLEHMGYRGMPIIALLSFLIGVVLAYQMGLQLEVYGANVYIVNLSGKAIFREFAPLLTAIIAAGRTSSSITAQLGLMKVNEEVDALRTMGLSPINRLVIPKFFGLLLALPLLTVWSSVFGILGSMLMAKGMLGVAYHEFIARFKDVIDLTDYWVGMVRTPVFAIIVSTVGCFQGFSVSPNAESIGLLTTRSVVQSIFLIIVVDAGFSVLFSKLGV